MANPEAQWLTSTEYCAHRKIHKTRLSELIRSKRLDGCWKQIEGRRYLVDWKKADAELDKTAHFRRNLENTGALPILRQTDNPTNDANETSEQIPDEPAFAAAKQAVKKAKSSGAVQDFAQSKEEEAHFKAKLARAKFEELDGTLIEAEVAKQQMYEVCRAIRDNLIELPDRVAAEFAAIRDERKISIRLDEELRTALERVIKIIEKHDE